MIVFDWKVKLKSGGLKLPKLFRIRHGVRKGQRYNFHRIGGQFAMCRTEKGKYKVKPYGYIGTHTMVTREFPDIPAFFVPGYPVYINGTFYIFLTPIYKTNGN